MRVSTNGHPKLAFAASPLQANLWSNTSAKGYHEFLSRNKIAALRLPQGK
ncbi:hypothetical protein [Bradyrhizobium sp. BR 10289]|nr:hypothetical protein [Bradyrhizobium sp. BR 10289]MBW7968705.1 hypothetical protein [Bradyrhizobium sp. BR 10289]